MIALEILEQSVATLRINDQVIARVKELTGRRCLGCERAFSANDKIVRGVCRSCYGVMNRAIQTRRVSEKDLIREGRILAASRGGRRPQNPIARELAEV